MTAGAEPEISVCVLAGHGAAALEECLRSLAEQSSAPSFELLVGGIISDPNVELICQHFPQASLTDTWHLLPGAARNVLIEQARGKLLLFLDDDVTAPSDLLRSLSEAAAAYPEASVFGGPNETPPDSSRFQLVQGAVLSSLLGSGPVSRRYGARSAGFADERWFTLCNLAVRREAMRPFRHELVCAEENALLAELQRRGELMRYEPQLGVFHTRRGTPTAFIRQMFKYGRGRGQLIARTPQTCRVAYLVPAALLVYLAALVLTLLIVGNVAPLGLVPAAVYLGLTIASGAWIGQTLGRFSQSPLATALIWGVHLSYGAGLIRGVIIPTRKRQRAQGPARLTARGPATEDP